MEWAAEPNLMPSTLFPARRERRQGEQREFFTVVVGVDDFRFFFWRTFFSFCLPRTSCLSVRFVSLSFPSGAVLAAIIRNIVCACC